jgi:hypothetical protein
VLFCTFVRPFLEFSSIIWNFYTISDINRIESVQRSFAEIVNCLHSSIYKECLINLGLDNLHCMSLKGDLVFSYTFLHGIVDIETDEFITLSSYTHLRGNQFNCFDLSKFVLF